MGGRKVADGKGPDRVNLIYRNGLNGTKRFEIEPLLGLKPDFKQKLPNHKRWF